MSDFTTYPAVNDEYQFAPEIREAISEYDELVAAFANKAMQTMIESGRLTESSLDSAYASKAVQTLIESGRLSPTNLSSSFANKATQTLVETGRLSAFQLGNKYGNRIITPEAYGAIGDGTADDGTALRLMFNDLEPGTTVMLSGRYRFTTHIPIDSKTRFKVTGFGTLIWDPSVPSSLGSVRSLRIISCEDFVFENFRLVSTQPYHESSGISTTTCKHGIFDDLTIVDFGFNGIGILATTSVNITISNCNIIRNRFGIVANGTNLKIFGNYVTNDWFTLPEASSPWVPSSKHWDGIMLGEGSTGICNDNVIVETGQSGIYGQAGFGWSIVGNYVARNQNKGIDIGSTTAVKGKYFTITGNTCVDNYTANIHLANTYHSVVSGNTAINSDTLYYGSKLNGPSIALTAGCYMVGILSNMVRQATAIATAAIRITAGQTGNEVTANIVDASTKYAVPSGNTLNFTLTP